MICRSAMSPTTNWIGVAMHALVLAEERFLHARFGPAFVAYARVTPRYGVRLR